MAPHGFPLMRINFICSACPCNAVGQAKARKAFLIVPGTRILKCTRRLILSGEWGHSTAFKPGAEGWFGYQVRRSKIEGAWPPRKRPVDHVMTVLCFGKYVEQEVARLNNKQRLLSYGPLSAADIESDRVWAARNDRMIERLVQD